MFHCQWAQKSTSAFSKHALRGLHSMVGASFSRHNFLSLQGSFKPHTGSQQQGRGVKIN